MHISHMKATTMREEVLNWKESEDGQLGVLGERKGKGEIF